MVPRRPSCSQIAVKGSKVNDGIICPLNFKTYSHLFQLHQELTIHDEEMASFFLMVS